MMPIASPTQAIVFGSEPDQLKQMIRAGIHFNLWGVLIITPVFYLLAKFVVGIDLKIC
jgi:sodium-dependent dicarboxylate transporter 2/3/5